MYKWLSLSCRFRIVHLNIVNSFRLTYLLNISRFEVFEVKEHIFMLRDTQYSGLLKGPIRQFQYVN